MSCNCLKIIVKDSTGTPKNFLVEGQLLVDLFTDDSTTYSKSKKLKNLSFISNLAVEVIPSINVPDTVTNRYIFKDYINNVYNFDNQAPIRMMVFEAGLYVDTYDITVSNYTEGNSFSLKFNNTDEFWLTKLKNTRLCDLDLPFIEINETTILEARDKDGYYDGTNPVSYPLVDFGGISSEDSLDESNFRPFVSPTWLLQEVIKSTGYCLNAPIIDTDWFRRQWDYLIKLDQEDLALNNNFTASPEGIYYQEAFTNSTDLKTVNFGDIVTNNGSFTQGTRNPSTNDDYRTNVKTPIEVIPNLPINNYPSSNSNNSHIYNNTGSTITVRVSGVLSMVNAEEFTTNNYTIPDINGDTQFDEDFTSEGVRTYLKVVRNASAVSTEVDELIIKVLDEDSDNMDFTTWDSNTQNYWNASVEFEAEFEMYTNDHIKVRYRNEVNRRLYLNTDTPINIDTYILPESFIKFEIIAYDTLPINTPFKLNQFLDCDISLYDYLYGNLHIFNGKLDINNVDKVINIYPNNTTTLPTGEVVDGYFTGEEIDLTEKIICDTRKINFKNDIGRYVKLSWGDAGDSYIEEKDLDTDLEPLYGSVLDYRRSYDNSTNLRDISNPVYQPTTSVSQQYDFTADTLNLGIFYDNVDISVGGNINSENSTDIDARRIFITPLTNQNGGNKDVRFNDIDYDDWIYGYQQYNIDEVERDLDFNGQLKPFYSEFILNQMFSKSEEFLVYLTPKDFREFDFRKYYRINYKGVEYLAIADLIKDFRACKNIPTPITFRPIVYIDECNVEF